MTIRVIQPAIWLLWLSYLVQGSFWTVTSNFIEDLTTITETYGTSEDPYTYTTTRTILSGVIPTVTAISSSTYYRTYDDLEIVSIWYPPNAVAESQLVPEATGFATGFIDDAYTYFRMPVTFTAPATCSSDFTYSTTMTVSVPSEVIDQISPASITTNSLYTHATYVTWFLTPSAVPLTSTEEYVYSAYIASCSKPPSYYGYHSDDDDDDDSRKSSTYCVSYWGCSTLKTWIIVVATVPASLFVLGFVESWFWFSRLMKGRRALRFGTLCWTLISLWVICFTRTQPARSAEDQKLLREQWKKTPSRTAFRLWWKWGFRHAYPTELLGEYSKTTVGVTSAEPSPAEPSGTV